jgi:hypothetical protein
MQTVTTIGLDIAKSVFQVHGVKHPCKYVMTSLSHAREIAQVVNG